MICWAQRRTVCSAQTAKKGLPQDDRCQLAQHIIGSYHHAWQCNTRWWYHRATPADAFLLGPSGYGYVYPALLDRASQRAFATATADAAAALGMTGYIHWDWLGDFDVGLGTKRTAASIDR